MKRSGASLALSAVLAFGAAGEAKAGSWDEKVFASHVDFDAVARAGESAVPALIERGRQLFKAKFTTEDGAGRPKATQAIVPTKRKRGTNPPFSRTSGPIPIPAQVATKIRSPGAAGISSPMSSSRKGLKAPNSTILIRPSPASGIRSL